VPKIAYLTIDDAPSQDFPGKLDFLDSKGIRAVWFCQGNYMEQRPEMVIEAIRRRHVIGNHSYSHPHFSSLALDQCYAEIRATDAVMNDLYVQSGVERPARYFRFPYGDKGEQHHAAVQRYLRNLGYSQPAFADITYAYYREGGYLDDVDWYWTFDTHDWAIHKENPPHGINSVQKILERMDEDVPEAWRGLNDAQSADIVLTHDVENTVFVAEVGYMIEKGIQFRLP
jgi:peptidoglycan-N-acetylglucosamine deacetylase